MPCTSTLSLAELSHVELLGEWPEDFMGVPCSKLVQSSSVQAIGTGIPVIQMCLWRAGAYWD
jgi:hypothetical protein